MMSLVTTTATRYGLSFRSLSDLDFPSVDCTAHTIIRSDSSGLNIAALLSELSSELWINR
jgi:hypothetical protein